jgi:hypothetical protein
MGSPVYQSVTRPSICTARSWTMPTHVTGRSSPWVCPGRLASWRLENYGVERRKARFAGENDCLFSFQIFLCEYSRIVGSSKATESSPGARNPQTRERSGIR